MALLAVGSLNVAFAQAPASSSASQPAATTTSAATAPAKTEDAKPDAKPGTAPAAVTAPKDASPRDQAKDQLAEDTAKLLQLANELKVEMDKSTKDTLSLSVMKKADEIEKLAKKVRAEMKTDLGN